MTNLHYLLIGLAVLLVVGVMLYNHLQERRLRKQIDGMFQNNLADTYAELGNRAPADVQPEADRAARLAPDTEALPVAVDEVQDTYDEMLTLMRRVSQENDDEPIMPPPLADDDAVEKQASDSAVQPEPVSPWQAADVVPPDIDVAPPSSSHAASPEPSAVQTLATSPLDADVECIARLRASHRGMATYAALIDRVRRIGKPVRAYGYGDQASWQSLPASATGDYSVIEIGMQLVDRKGPVSSSQLDEFCNALYEYAAEHGGAVTCPDLAGTLDKTKRLDDFCMAVDMLIGLNIVAPEGMPFLVKRVDDLARRAGMTLSRQGTYVMDDAAGHGLFSLANQRGARFVPEDASQSTPSVTLLFDVPNIADGLTIFDRMTTLGFELARSLGGHMMDDHGHVVTQASLRSDRQQLEGFYSRMRAEGIAAGSERARRLFA